MDTSSPFFNASYGGSNSLNGSIGGGSGSGSGSGSNTMTGGRSSARRTSNNDNFSNFGNFNNISNTSASGSESIDDFSNEPPLLEELGINFHNIFEKTLHVVIPRKNLDEQILSDGDLAGPIIFNLMLGFCLLLAGKVHFGYIYGFTVIGCFGLNLMLNLMSDIGIKAIDTVSIIGYCILPIVLLASINIIFDMRGKIGFIVSICIVLWSTSIATRFIERLALLRHARWLIAYPIAIFYACFVLITVF